MVANTSFDICVVSQILIVYSVIHDWHLQSLWIHQSQFMRTYRCHIHTPIISRSPVSDARDTEYMIAYHQAKSSIWDFRPAQHLLQTNSTLELCALGI